MKGGSIMRANAKDGSVNETMILTALNKRRYIDLDPNWQRHIKRMFKTIRDEDIVYVNYHECKDAKPDLDIIVNNRKICLSVKSGHAPNMHHEPLKTFYDFLRAQGVPERIIKIISFYHYGYSLRKRVADHALSRDEILARYGTQINEANTYFLKHQDVVRELIYRTILRGRLKRDIIDYLYYGNASKGFLLSVSDILYLIMKNKNEECPSIHFNQLTYVSCARNLDKDRIHNVKINWPILCKYFYDEEFMKRYG